MLDPDGLYELADDLHSSNGILLIARGQVVTERLLVRVRNFAESAGLRGQITIIA